MKNMIIISVEDI